MIEAHSNWVVSVLNWYWYLLYKCTCTDVEKGVHYEGVDSWLCGSSSKAAYECGDVVYGQSQCEEENTSLGRSTSELARYQVGENVHHDVVISDPRWRI